MKKWEYDWISIKDEDVVDTLVALDLAGSTGWEFTGHTEDTGSGKSYLMKRRWYK